MNKVNIMHIVEYRDELHQELTRKLQILKGLDKSHPNRPNVVQRIRQINEELAIIERLYQSLANFQSEEFTDFMTKFLLLTEGSFVRSVFSAKNSKVPSHYVISSKETKEFLKERIRTNRDLETFFRGETPEDVTKFEGATVYPFERSLRMQDKFAKHPRLRLAIYEVMQIKADNPEKRDTEVFSMVLDNTLRRNLKRSEDAYYQKRKESNN